MILSTIEFVEFAAYCVWTYVFLHSVGEYTWLNPVMRVVFMSSAATLLWWIIIRKSSMWFHGPMKKWIMNQLAPFVSWECRSVDETLQLDAPSMGLLEKRTEGFNSLRTRMKVDKSDVACEIFADPRFRRTGILLPILKALELPLPSVVASVDGAHVILPSGERRIHLTGDAVHIFKQETYERINRAAPSFSPLQFAPVTVTPSTLKNAEKIVQMTGLDKVRYFTSGSEAVDGAFREARFCTGKPIIVRFKGAYHGHTSGTSFGGSNQVVLKEMDDKALEYIEKYHYKICGVVVNPMQHFTGVNALSPPGEKLTMGARGDRATETSDYSAWLKKLQEKCDYCCKFLTPIAFIMDDVYFGFRTPSAFSFVHFGLSTPPDLLVLGKGIAGGRPLSVVVGRSNFMNHSAPEHILKISTIVGTMSGWAGGIAASNAFLDEWPTLKAELGDIISAADAFSSKVNEALESAECPVRIRNFSNTFTVQYESNSLYNSLFPMYLADAGVFLSNQTTGKFNLGADLLLSDIEDVESASAELMGAFVKAASRMKDDGFFEVGNNGPTEVKKGLAKRFAMSFLSARYEQIWKDKMIDINVSHNHPVNKFTHFWSSVVMICFSYWPLMKGQWLKGFLIMLLAQILRQMGHFFYEKQDRDAEKLKFGHKDPSKKLAAVGVVVAFFVWYFRQSIYVIRDTTTDQFVAIAGFMAFLPHAIEIVEKYGIIRAIDWILKILTDPFTDLYDFKDSMVIKVSEFGDFKKQFGTYKFHGVGNITEVDEATEGSDVSEPVKPSSAPASATSTLSKEKEA